MTTKRSCSGIGEGRHGEKGKKVIVKLEPGNSPIKGLVDFLISKDGSEHFAELKKLGEEYYPKPR